MSDSSFYEIYYSKHGIITVPSTFIASFEAGTCLSAKASSNPNDNTPYYFNPGSSTWEIVCEFTTGSISDDQIIVGTRNYCAIPLFVKSDGTLRGYLSTKGSSEEVWDIADDLEIATLSANTSYKIKVEFTGSSYKWYSWQSNSWTLLKTLTSSTPVFSGSSAVDIGGSYDIYSTEYFRGTIDLKKLYIRVGANIVWQAVKSASAGYKLNCAVIGSPSISDDFIVSNFSTTSFLRLLTNPFSGSYNTCSITIKVTTASSFGDNIISRSGKYVLYLGTNNASFSSNGLSFNIGSINYSIPLSSTTWVRLSHDGTTYTYEYSSDGTTWTTAGTKASTSKLYSESTALNFGVNSDAGATTGSNPFNGSIDMKETFIIIDGVEVWRGITSESNSGYISVSQGTYTDGTHDLILQDKEYSLQDLIAGQTVAHKNNTIAMSTSGVSTVKLSASLTPAGSPDVYANLNHPVYLSAQKEYIIGDTPLSSLQYSFVSSSGSATIPNDLISNGTPGGDTSAAFSSTNEGSYPAWKAFDGDTSSFWNPSSNSNPQSITRYFPTPVKVNEVVLQCFRGSNKPSSGEIQISSDNVTYTTIGSFSGNTATTITISCDDTVEGNYIRFYKTGNNVGWGSVSEMIIKYTTAPQISTTTKGFLYNSSTDDTFWLPSEVTVKLSDFESVADRCNIYVYNEPLTDTAKISVSTSAPANAENYIQAANYVYLNSTHDEILGVSVEPKDISFILKGSSVLTDYTVTGSPTIDSDYVVSGFSSSNYITSVLPTISTSFDFVSKLFLPATSTSSGSYPASFSFSGSNSSFGIGPSGSVFGGSLYLAANATGLDSSTFSNTWVWSRLIITTSSSDLYILLDPDNEYSLETLPPLSEWVHAATQSADNISKASGKTLYLGVNQYQSRSSCNWSIDLLNTSYTVDGSTTWRAAQYSSYDSVHVNNASYWTYLKVNTYDVQGASLAISDISPTSLTGYLLAKTSGDVVYSEANKQFGSEGLTAYEAWTGSTVTFTDNTYTAFDSVDKVGTRCRVYADIGNSEVPNRYIAITQEQYEAGVPVGSSVAYFEENYGLDQAYPIQYSSYVTTSEEMSMGVSYSEQSDTFEYYQTGVWTGYRTLTYVGDMQVILPGA